MHMISRKVLNPAELDTVEVLFKNPRTVVAANGELQTKEEADSVCQRIGLLRDHKASRRYTGSSFTRKTMRRSREKYHWTSGQKPQLIKNGRKIECNTANYAPFVVSGLSTSSSSSCSLTFPASSSQEAVTPTQHPASIRSKNMSDEVRGDSSVDQQKPKTQIPMTTKKYGATRCVICQNG